QSLAWSHLHHVLHYLCEAAPLEAAEADRNIEDETEHMFPGAQPRSDHQLDAAANIIDDINTSWVSTGDRLGDDDDSDTQPKDAGLGGSIFDPNDLEEAEKGYSRTIGNVDKSTVRTE
ncbi:hypothetical protein LTR66_013820, partial [Elasticomyces elasticus]